jgi:transposase
LATVGLLTGAYHLSKRTAQEILRDLFGVRMSLGAVSGCEQSVSNALAAAVREAHEWVQEQRTAHADETGWRERRRLAWLWVMATRLVTVFKVHARRNREAARSLLGRFRGVLHSDRWAAYNIHTGLRQLCWAHLLRDFTAMGEAGGRAGGIGRRLVRRAKRVLKRWHCVRDGTWSRRKFFRSTVYLRGRIERDLATGAQCGHAKTEHSCRRILKLSGALWTFAHKPGVEPTNNAAERAIRPAVLWRKRSFGTHSERGSRFAERMLTTFMTLKQQQRPVVDYVRQACQAFLQGQRVPSLLPISK